MVPIVEFFSVPPGVENRHRFLGQFGNLDGYLYDLYTIALSNIAQGFDPDLEDAIFLIKNELIDLPELQRLYQIILLLSPKADIHPQEFEQYFHELLRSLKKTISSTFHLLSPSSYEYILSSIESRSFDQKAVRLPPESLQRFFAIAERMNLNFPTHKRQPAHLLTCLVCQQHTIGAYAFQDRLLSEFSPLHSSIDCFISPSGFNRFSGVNASIDSTG